jgi:hypothetical protein
MSKRNPVKTETQIPAGDFLAEEVSNRRVPKLPAEPRHRERVIDKLAREDKPYIPPLHHFKKPDADDFERLREFRSDDISPKCKIYWPPGQTPNHRVAWVLSPDGKKVVEIKITLRELNV